MSYTQLARHALRIKPLAERANKVVIERDAVTLDVQPCAVNEAQQQIINEAIERVQKARANDKPVMMAFGAHSIKNGLAPVLIELMEKGWITHLATNGAGIIHDWEFAFQGESSEDVRANVADGQFGIWHEEA